MKKHMPGGLYYSERELWRQLESGQHCHRDVAAALLERIARLRQSATDLQVQLEDERMPPPTKTRASVRAKS